MCAYSFGDHLTDSVACGLLIKPAIGADQDSLLKIRDLHILQKRRHEKRSGQFSCGQRILRIKPVEAARSSVKEEIGNLPA